MNTYSYEEVTLFENIIRNNYKDNRIDTDSVLKEASEKLTYNKIKDMLTDTVNCKQHDGRISDGVKRWAKECERGELVGIDRVNPGLVDLVCNKFRQFETIMLKNAIRSDFSYFPQKDKTTVTCGNLSLERVMNVRLGYAIDTYTDKETTLATVTRECFSADDGWLWDMTMCLENYRRENNLEYGKDPCEKIAEENNIDIAVVKNVNDYLKDKDNSLSNYELVDVCPKSNHPADSYLYMVTAKNVVTGEYAVWTSWNETMQSLNYGHYGLEESEVEEVINTFFHNAYEAYGITAEKARDLNYVNEVLAQVKKEKSR